MASARILSDAAQPLSVQSTAEHADAPRMALRVATPTDIPALMALKREMAIADGSEPLVDATVEDWVMGGFGPRPQFAAFVAEPEQADDDVVGMLIFNERYYAGWARPSFYVQDLYVVPAYRRRGIGRDLLARLSAHAVSRNAAMVEMHAHTANPAGQLYRRAGFQPQPQCRAYTLWGPALAKLADSLMDDAGRR